MAAAGNPWQNDFMSATLPAAVLCMTAGVAAVAGATAARAGNSPALEGGIWKAVVPLKPMRGEFGNMDPIGVAAGARILADCSINWINPDDGARYCFSSGTSLVYFLDRPQYNIERARASWRKMNEPR
jgi:hypothetical protein